MKHILQIFIVLGTMTAASLSVRAEEAKPPAPGAEVNLEERNHNPAFDANKGDPKETTAGTTAPNFYKDGCPDGTCAKNAEPGNFDQIAKKKASAASAPIPTVTPTEEKKGAN